jgi:hypothetical protein
MSPSAETKKTEVIQGMLAVRGEILAAAASLPPEKQAQVFLGTWTIFDLLAHLAGWDDANLEAAQAVLEARLPAFYADYDRDWQRCNALLVEQYRRDGFASQLALVRQSHRALLAHLETVSPSDFVKDTGVRFHGWRVTIEKLLCAETSDEKKHLEQITVFASASPPP